MKILVIGSGAREHALVRKLLASPQTTQIYCAPGNPGMANEAKLVSIASDDLKGLVEFALDEKIDFTVVGPEQPLTMGIVDEFEKHQLKIFGPNREASQLEASKIFTKNFCKEFNLPTAQGWDFFNAEEAKNFLKSHNQFPIVIKADGLAAGKGVVIAQSLNQAVEALDELSRLGDAANKILIEEFLSGEEASYIVLVDGQSFRAFPAAQDHKAIFDGDQGPNTGGMGAYAPVPLVDSVLREKIEKKIIQPTIDGLRARGIVYKGFLFAGLMIVNGEPYLLEYNCRLGDPETQVLLPLLKSDLVTVITSALNQKLDQCDWVFHKGSQVGVVLAAEGYPGKIRKGDVIFGLSDLSEKNSQVFFAGVDEKENRLVTSGGRVLTVSAAGDSLSEAIEKTYELVRTISWNGVQYRRDIGSKGLKRTS